MVDVSTRGSLPSFFRYAEKLSALKSEISSPFLNRSRSIFSRSLPEPLRSQHAECRFQERPHSGCLHDDLIDSCIVRQRHASQAKRIGFRIIEAGLQRQAAGVARVL